MQKRVLNPDIVPFLLPRGLPGISVAILVSEGRTGKVLGEAFIGPANADNFVEFWGEIVKMCTENPRIWAVMTAEKKTVMKNLDSGNEIVRYSGCVIQNGLCYEPPEELLRVSIDEEPTGDYVLTKLPNAPLWGLSQEEVLSPA